MNYIDGIVKAIIFHSEENSYTIIKIKATDMTENVNLFAYDDYDYITVTGYFPQPMRGEEIRFFGEFKEHKRYGYQYVIRSYEKLSDTSIPGLIEYLSSDLFKGIGIKTAQNIVQKLGENTIKKIIDDKSVLDSVPKLNDKQKDTIYHGIIENKASEHTLIQLYGYGISPKMAIKIFHHYQNETLAIIQQNPYQLILDIEGIGFERADRIAKQLGFDDNHPLRIKAMIVYLYQLMGLNYGHTFLYEHQLLEYLVNTINRNESLVDEDKILSLLDDLIEEKLFVRENDMIKLKSIEYAELHIKSKIKEFSEIEEPTIDTKKVDDYIDLFESIQEIEYTELQRKAIHTAMKQPLFILTGGPGTGKTTVIKGIVFVYAKYHQIPITYNNPLFDIKLIAPTGRAAKRMNEATNYYAETIHRFLGYGFDGKFMFNKDNQVSAEMIIIDEASMIDVFLASQLLQSIPKNTKVIIVGDEDQLPSVGPGQVLKDFIDTDIIEYVRLTTIHRQAMDSHIIKLAHSINNAEVPTDILRVFEDRYFVEEKAQTFSSRLINVMNYLAANNYDLLEDVQILIPMYRGSTGIDHVNKLIQEELNPQDTKKIEHGDREFRIGDKVIQLVNQVEDNIMNGDQGIVVGITDENVVIVDFMGNEVTYKTSDLINLKHAYAMSIHKSQGSEYKVVIMPIFRSYSVMLKRKLLYTGITRAKEKLILIGELNSFKYGVERIEEGRQSTLRDTIIDFVVSQNTTKEISPSYNKSIMDKDIPFTFLGEDFGEDVSPYDFMETTISDN